MISPLAYVDPEAKLGKNVTVLPSTRTKSTICLWRRLAQSQGKARNPAAPKSAMYP